MESICVITLEQRIGCLNMNLDPEIQKLLKSMKNFLGSYGNFMTEIPTWKFLPPRWNKTYR